MKLLNLNIDYSKSISYVPKSITNKAIVTYIFALIACSVLYMQYALTWYWVLFGLVEVVGFFYFTNKLTKKWSKYSPQYFAKKLFWTALIIRVVYVLFSYWFYYEMTDGTYFDIGAADVLGYHDEALYAAEKMRNGDWNIISNIQDYMQCSFSDTGYGAYLSIVYFLTDDSILFARLLKALWSALTVLLIYKLASRNFGESTARIVAILCMLMPNLIYYCGLHLKEIEMVFLEVLFVERADYMLKSNKLTFWSLFLLMLVPIYMFTIRTALAAVMVAAFCLTLLIGSNKVVVAWKIYILIFVMTIFVGAVILGNTSIGADVRAMWETKGSQQTGNMEWRSNRKDSAGFTQKYARYAGAAVFAPMIFTIPFPTMAETPGQENQKMIHGGNFDKNISSFFTIFALFVLLFSGDWRRYVLPISILCGYLIVVAFSSFGHSERFHLPSLPFALMFAAYGISIIKTKRKYMNWFIYWCVAMFVATITWNWFKLAGRGMI